ncbi:MAG TPA: MBL fold metallo-hydrolase [Solirubrobacteraceae bacterium]|jgi:glyoxylase-like metal-dependent hydrolase (beta-lactamase superfamily II)|nr:MBL fold metallo-hydrolase [Solirubrobacteraceae bacterium]
MSGELVDDWFYTRQLAPGVWLIAEPQHVCSYLVEGSERSVLLDTGLGVRPIRPVAEALASSPVEVVNTHYHFDHIGGNHEFERISIHEIGAPLIEADVPADWLVEYLAYAQRQLEAFEVLRPLDGEFSWILGRESIPVPFPAGFEASQWSITPTKASVTLSHGDSIDLGDRALTVIHAPGHSPDGICLLDEREGLLFAGDSSNSGPIYAHFPDSDLDALTTSAHMLAGLADQVRVAMFCHYGRPVAEPDLFGEIAAGLERVRGGDVELMPGIDIVGGPMLEARFDHFSVTVPEEARGAG